MKYLKKMIQMIRTRGFWGVLIQILMIITQVLIWYSMHSQFKAEECKRVSDLYFRIYTHYRDDINTLNSSNYPNLDKRKITVEMKRIANNTIRHFSFESERPYLVFKALEAILSYHYSENEKNQSILDKLPKEKEPKLKDVVSELEKEDQKWPNYKKYQNWINKNNCF